MSSAIVKSIYLFANGNTAAFDLVGNQMPEFHENLIINYLTDLKKRGVDILALEIHYSEREYIIPHLLDDGSINIEFKNYKTPQK
jgi:hypothetical protein